MSSHINHISVNLRISTYFNLANLQILIEYGIYYSELCITFLSKVFFFFYFSFQRIKLLTIANLVPRVSVPNCVGLTKRATLEFDWFERR